MSGWFGSVSKLLGIKKKRFMDLSKEEKQKALQELKLRQRKLEQKITMGEKEMSDIAKELLNSSKFKAPMLVNKLKQKKNLMAARLNNFNLSGMNLNALETSIELEELLGNKADKTVLHRMEALSPASLEAFLEYMKDEMAQTELNSEGIQEIMSSFTTSIDKNTDRDMLELVGEVQDAVLDNNNLSEEEKVKKILDMI